MALSPELVATLLKLCRRRSGAADPGVVGGVVSYSKPLANAFDSSPGTFEYGAGAGLGGSKVTGASGMIVYTWKLWSFEDPSQSRTAVADSSGASETVYHSVLRLQQFFTGPRVHESGQLPRPQLPDRPRRLRLIRLTSPPDTVFPYRIDFENAPTATAPAQQVVITDPLDPNLDWSTLPAHRRRLRRHEHRHPAG